MFYAVVILDNDDFGHVLYFTSTTARDSFIQHCAGQFKVCQQAEVLNK